MRAGTSRRSPGLLAVCLTLLLVLVHASATSDVVTWSRGGSMTVAGRLEDAAGATVSTVSSARSKAVRLQATTQIYICNFWFDAADTSMNCTAHTNGAFLSYFSDRIPYGSCQVLTGLEAEQNGTLRCDGLSGHPIGFWNLHAFGVCPFLTFNFYSITRSSATAHTGDLHGFRSVSHPCSFRSGFNTQLVLTNGGAGTGASSVVWQVQASNGTYLDASVPLRYDRAALYHISGSGGGSGAAIRVLGTTGTLLAESRIRPNLPVNKVTHATLYGSGSTQFPYRISIVQDGRDVTSGGIVSAPMNLTVCGSLAILLLLLFQRSL